MRITNGMMADQVVFNMQRSLRRFMDMQTQMSSGRRINRPSDDPLGTQRDLDYRTELAKIAQYRDNISQGVNWMRAYDSILADTKDYISRAKELAVNMADDSFDDQARLASASEVQSMFEQLILMANKELSGRRIFGGHRTKTAPFTNATNGVVYQGDQGQIQFEVDSSQLMNINLTGESVFLAQTQILGDDADLNVGVTDTTLLADLQGGAGIDLGTFVITDVNRELVAPVTVDVSAATTVGEAITAINTALTAGGMTNVTARLGDDGNNIVLETTNDGEISNTTLIRNLHQGAGVDLLSGKVRVTNGAGIDVLVDLAGAETIDDVITMFNDRLDQADIDLGGVGLNNVRLQLNATRTGLDVVDSNGTSLGLTIEDSDGESVVAEQLGITGSVAPTLNGQALEPQTHFTITENGGTTGEDLGLVGEFFRTKVGDDLDPTMLNALPADILLSDLSNRQGFGSGEIAIHHGNFTHTFDFGDPSLVTLQDLLDEINNSGLDITASVNESGRGIQIVNNDLNRSLVIEDLDQTRVAKDLDIFGAADVIGNMIALRNALQRDDREGAGLLLEGMDESILELLNHRSTVGARHIRLESTDQRLVGLDLNFTELLSGVEDADITKLVTDLAAFENNYQASMIATAKIIQPSLLNFLDF
jgi:flagellar hook-associated protein 3 FlgL